MDITSVKRIEPKRIGMTVTELSRCFGISRQTVYDRINEIEQEVAAKRYGPHSIMRDVGLVLINPLVFTDYMVYRSRLKNKNLRKTVPAYDPVKTSQELQLQISVDID